MGDGPKPFFGVLGPPTSEEPAQISQYPYFPEPEPPPEEEQIIEGSFVCEQCQEPIYENEIAVEVLIGYLVKGKKSGRFMVEQLNDEMTPAIVHDFCCHKFCWEQIVVDIDDKEVDPFDESKYCAGCSVKLGD